LNTHPRDYSYLPLLAILIGIFSASLGIFAEAYGSPSTSHRNLMQSLFVQPPELKIQAQGKMLDSFYFS
jgi:hypothetical protein